MNQGQRRFVRGARALLLGALLLGAAPLPAKDIYRRYLDPAQPHHRAILDTLERLKAAPNDAALHNDLGCLIAWDGFWRDALQEFETAAKLDKKDSRPLFNAGLVHAWRESWGPAKRSFAAATDREAGNWPAWWMLGFANEKLGSVDAAVDAYKTSLRVDTSLFEVARNPFAADTKLKAFVLLQTYQRRRVRAAMPLREEFAGPERLAGFFQKAAAAAAPAAEETVPASTGPVVTVAPAPSSGPPAGRAPLPGPAKGFPQKARIPEPEPQAVEQPPPPPPDNVPLQNVTPAPAKKRPALGPGGAPSEE